MEHSDFFLCNDILAAYKHADGKKIDGKRVLVDVERARTVKGWLPRRLGKCFIVIFTQLIDDKYTYCGCSFYFIIFIV